MVQRTKVKNNKLRGTDCLIMIALRPFGAAGNACSRRVGHRVRLPKFDQANRAIDPTQAWRDEKVMTEALREYRVKQWRKAEGARKKQEREMRKALTRPRTLASQPSQQINKRPTREAEVTDEGDIDAMMAMLD